MMKWGKSPQWIREQAPKGIIGQGALEAKRCFEYFKSGKSPLSILASPGLYAQWESVEF